ncbi:SURF1 family protein [Acuticoccus kandeliae]|uniref:SURF1 family protein n=1 Tax=Acuticoccus kandeliae TaxID=2073160 RepID=UPI00196A313A|nr:SURF1 family protein [Acuticoccus kandeliae]
MGGRGRLVTILLLAALGVSLFASLGVWQVERRAWKLDLIAQVDARLGAEPVAAPGPDAWAAINRADDQYRRVTVTGNFRPEDVLVQAVTEEGPGFWVLSPLVSEAGDTLLVNRGFVPQGMRDAAARRAPEGAVTVTGLLRMSEPKGGFLRANDPAAGRFYSRDVPVIAETLGLGPVAPYFVDAESGAAIGAYPVPGLTVVNFRNSHLIYALTWFGLALMVVGGAVIAVRHERRRDDPAAAAVPRAPVRGIPHPG